MPREQLELHQETHVDVSQDDIEQLETNILDASMDQTMPSSASQTQESVDFDASASQTSQGAQSSSKAESRAQSYPSNASSGFITSVREEVVKKAEEQVP